MLVVVVDYWAMSHSERGGEGGYTMSQTQIMLPVYSEAQQSCHVFTLAGLPALLLLAGHNWSSGWPSEPT